MIVHLLSKALKRGVDSDSEFPAIKFPRLCFDPPLLNFRIPIKTVLTKLSKFTYCYVPESTCGITSGSPMLQV